MNHHPHEAVTDMSLNDPDPLIQTREFRFNNVSHTAKYTLLSVKQHLLCVLIVYCANACVLYMFSII